MHSSEFGGRSLSILIWAWLKPADSVIILKLSAFLLTQMRLAFFQAALLAAAVTATDSETGAEETEQSYYPDLLVQTASLVDYFYPAVNNEDEQVNTTLAQTQTDIKGSGDVVTDTVLQGES